MKPCRSYSAVLPLTDFYRHGGMADGRLNRCKPCVRRRVKGHRVANLERIRQYDRERGYREGDPVKAAARRKVNHEIAAGRLIREPCVVCGDAKSEAHHIDYSKPLGVQWLCKPHHAEIHRKED